MKKIDRINMFLRSGSGDAIGDKVARMGDYISWQINAKVQNHQSLQTVLEYHASCFLRRIIDSV